MNFTESGKHFIFERKPTELEEKLQEIIDELNDDIGKDTYPLHKWKLAWIVQLQGVIYQIQMNDINPVWERKEANNE
jgi:hypothetical protein